MYIFVDFEPKLIEEDILVSKLSNKVHDGVLFGYDGRTNTIHAVPEDFVLTDEWYFRYLDFLNDIVTSGLSFVQTGTPIMQFNMSELSPAQALIGAGFVPLAIEPSFTSGQLSRQVMGVLQRANIPYKEIYPVSFVSAKETYTRNDRRDIWVHRMDFVNGGQNPNMITTASLWKELNLIGLADVSGRVGD